MPSSSLLQQRITFAPALTNSYAQPLPMPLLLPVITATLSTYRELVIESSKSGALSVHAQYGLMSLVIAEMMLVIGNKIKQECRAVQVSGSERVELELA
jgi:hypothetical protein